MSSLNLIARFTATAQSLVHRKRLFTNMAGAA
jgi:hypothetical protein